MKIPSPIHSPKTVDKIQFVIERNSWNSWKSLECDAGDVRRGQEWQDEHGRAQGTPGVTAI